MAEHNLTIKATLDTSSVQRELDQINRTVMTMNGATGVSGSTRNSAGGIGNLNKISTAIDKLNRTIDKLSNQMTRMGQQAVDRGREVITRGGGGVVDVGSPVAPITRGKAGPKTKFGQWVKANRFARADAMPLFMFSSWGSRLGEAFTDAGHENIGGALDFIGDIAGGAASGSIRGGLAGAVLGGLIGAFASATKTVTQFNSELEKTVGTLGENIKEAQRTREDYLRNRAFINAQDYVREITTSDDGNFTKQQKLQPRLKEASDAEETAFDTQQKALSAIKKSEKALEVLQEKLLAIQTRRSESVFWGFGQETGAYIINNSPDFVKSGVRGIGGLFGRDILSPYDTVESVNEEIERETNNLKTQREKLKQHEREEAEWKSLRHTIEDAIKDYKKADDKFMADYEKQQKKNEEKRKKLTDKRSNLLLDIEDDYTQQGVDLLTSMGKAGKYMSSMEMASLNQERFSPITKKMDDMQKKLDLLASIDREIKAIDKPVGALKP